MLHSKKKNLTIGNKKTTPDKKVRIEVSVNYNIYERKCLRLKELELQ